MPRKFIKRFLPEPHRMRDHRHLKLFGEWIHDPNLWHLNRRSVSGAFAVGLFSAFMPVPSQMVLSGFIAILVRVNLPISVALVWITNPLTIPPMFYGAYKVGERVLGLSPQHFTFEPTLSWLTEQLADKWQPFLLGCFLLGSLSAITGFTLVRVLWRLHVLHHWGKRRRRIGRGSKGRTDRGMTPAAGANPGSAPRPAAGRPDPSARPGEGRGSR